jgi:aminotransferase in exopolysaccharide biosynthesis
MFQKTIDFIRELYRQPKGFIPLHVPIFGGNEKKYLNECIDTTFVSSVGKFVNQFEDLIAEFTSAKKAVACVNGTSALHIALKLVGVEKNDEVITQPLTFIATCNAISYIGAIPVFVDVDLDTLGMSPLSLSEFLISQTTQQFNNSTNKNECINKITGHRIKACVPMHTFGFPCKIDEISKICQKHNIELIEDAAESIGSFYKGKHTGTFGKIGVLSFNGNKTITTGGGGMLLFDDELLSKRAKHLTTQAKIPHPWEFAHDEIGYNYRMPNINAALGVAQMEQLTTFLANKRQIAQKYENFFSATTLDFFKEPIHSSSNFWLNAIILKNKAERDSFLDYTNKNEVMTRPAWQIMNQLKMYQKCQTDSLQNATFLADRLVNIPSSAFIQK